MYHWENDWNTRPPAMPAISLNKYINTGSEFLVRRHEHTGDEFQVNFLPVLPEDGSEFGTNF